MIFSGEKQLRLSASRALLAIVTAFVACGSLSAQNSTGRILGTITDQSGASVPGAAVTVTDTERGITRKLVTDTAGAFNAPSLIPGTYSVKVESQGFRTTERKGITLDVDRELQVDLVLQPGEQTQTVTITAEVPLLETTNATLGGTIENKVINDLPLNGRNFANLLDLRPGITKLPGGSNNNQSSNGGRPHGEMFLVDGVYSNDPWNAKSVMNATMAAGDAGTILPIEAISEFKTQANPTAEFGWKSGSATVVGLKSGTNGYHGSAYAYGRSGAWGAQNFFSSGQPKADLAIEQFGASLGAPIKKDRLFYFVNYEAQNYGVQTPVQHTVPIAIAGAGTAANSLILACQAAKSSATGLAAVSAQLAGLSSSCAPLGNYPGLFPNNTGTLTSFNTALSSDNFINSGVGKIDYQINDKHSFSGTYFMSQGDGTFVDNPLLEVDPNRRLLQTARAQFGSGMWTWTPNSRLVNVAHAGYSRYTQTFYSVDHTQDPGNYYGTYHLYTGQVDAVNFGFPQIAINPFNATLSGAGFPNLQGPDGVLYIADNVSYQKGRHSLMFGGQFQYNTADSYAGGTAKGSLTFPNLTSYFQGTMNRARTTAGNLFRNYKNQGYALFAQDEWHLRSNLILNLGVRYEINTVLKESNNLLGNFVPGTGLAQVGKQINAPFNGDHDNFAPRLGLAWSINPKTVLRLGGGVAYDNGAIDSLMSFANQFGLNSIPTNVPLYAGGNQTPTLISGGAINAANFTFSGSSINPVNANWRNNSAAAPLFATAPACGDGNTKLANGVTPGQCSIMGVDQNLRTAFVKSWLVDVQRSLGPNLSLDVAYIGNHGTKLLGVTDLNQAAYGSGWTPAVLAACVAAPTAGNCAPNGTAEQASRPYNAQFPYLKYIDYLSNSNYSNYNGLQVAMTQRNWHGLSYVAGYTWSHALGISSDSWHFILPINSANPKGSYGNTLFDIRHRFTYSLTYALPNVKTKAQLLEGWSINTIVHLQGGTPWGVNDTTSDFSGTGENGNSSQTTGERWNFYGDPSDFRTTKALLDTNKGAGGIPYYAGTSNPACSAQASKNGPAAVAALTVLGCYAQGSSVLIPPAYGSYGTLGTNPFRAPGFQNFDLSISKTFRFKERLRAQFRAEVFNLLNHPIFATPYGVPNINQNGTATDPSGAAGVGFGVNRATPDVASGNPVLGSGGPRAIQLGLKILF